jgi:hypothetical protein
MLFVYLCEYSKVLCSGEGPHAYNKPLRGYKLLGLKGNDPDGIPNIELVASLWNFRADNNGKMFL